MRVGEFSKVPRVTPADNLRVTSSARVGRLKKTDSLKENEDMTRQGSSLASTGNKIPFSSASHPVFSNYKSFGAVTKPLPEQQTLTYPLYDYADHIPKPKVIYITDEDHANEMVPGLNG